MRIRRSARAATTASSSAPAGSRSSRCRPRGDALDAAVGQPLARARSTSASRRRAVLAAGAAQVAVDLAGREQARRRRGPSIAGPPESTAQRSAAIAGRELGRGDHPAEPQRRRERLRRRAEIDDAVGREPLQRADRRAVVAVLGVVVVLEHELAAPHASSARRRSGESTAPVGNWCAGVTSTASASSAGSTRDAVARRPARRRPPGRRSGSSPTRRRATGPRPRPRRAPRGRAPGTRATAPACSRW